MKGGGTNRGIIIQAGSTTKKFPLFTNKSPQAGGMITRNTTGKGINGTTSGYLINKFNRTGTAGKKINIGRLSNIGVSRACIPERDHNNTRIQIRNPKMTSYISNRESMNIKMGKNKVGGGNK